MKRNWWSLVALTLVLALVVAVPPLSGAAKAVDLDTACSLTVEPGGPDLAEDLAAADVVLDLYRVAAARAVPGYDTYTYELQPEFAALELGENSDNAAWQALAQQAAALALDEASLIAPTVTGAPAGQPVTGLDAGLYLVLARGADLEDYTVTLPNGDGSEQLATKAESTAQVYTFLPELTSVPTKLPDANGVVSTANPGDWIYDAEITLKPAQAPRNGALEIVKTLDAFTQPATFVFDVEAELDGENVYSNVFSITFDAAGTQRLQVEGIPVGATVTVTEVYSGATYRLSSAASQTAEISAEQIVSVAFTNTPTNERRDSGSITNAFDYVDGQWQWQQIPNAA